VERVRSRFRPWLRPLIIQAFFGDTEKASPPRAE
jgi:hypothetical protein